MEITGGSWCFASQADVRFWGIETWSNRVLLDEFQKGSVGRGLCTDLDIQQMSDGFKEWAESEDAWFLLPHGRQVSAYYILDSLVLTALL